VGGGFGRLDPRIPSDLKSSLPFVETVNIYSPISVSRTDRRRLVRSAIGVLSSGSFRRPTRLFTRARDITFRNNTHYGVDYPQSVHRVSYRTNETVGFFSSGSRKRVFNRRRFVRRVVFASQRSRAPPRRPQKYCIPFVFIAATSTPQPLPTSTPSRSPRAYEIELFTIRTGGSRRRVTIYY